MPERDQPNNRNERPMKDEDVPNSEDKKIQQDFPGYPHNPSKYEVINPKDEEDKKTADLHEKDGEKINYTSDREKPEEDEDELENDGSGGAFDATENVSD